MCKEQESQMHDLQVWSFQSYDWWMEERISAR